MLIALNAVLPILTITLVGFFLLKLGVINHEVSRGLNHLVYWIGLPSLLFHKVATTELDWLAVGNVSLVFFVALGITILVAYLIAAGLKWDDPTTGSFVQASFRGNLGFVGLPVVLFATSDVMHDEVAGVAALLMAPGAIAFNFIAVTLMVRHQPEKNESSPRLLWSFVTNPLIVSGLLGIGFAMLKLRLPVFLDRSLSGLSDMSVPVALLGLGASFGEFSFASLKTRSLIVQSMLAAGMKLFISPLLGFLLAIWIGLNSVEARIAIVYLTAPTAIASYVLVEQFGCERKLAATAIVLSTFGSIVMLSVGIWITQESVWNRLI